jgi:TRAP-type mannitol/chloroaromatic compound transport system permease small subunit
MPILWPLKLSLAVGVGLLVLQGVSEFLKSMWAARSGEWIQ